MKKFLLYGISKRLLIKIIIALMIMLIGKNVFAAELNVNQYVCTSLNSNCSKYKGTEIYNTGTVNNYSINTRYNGRLSRIQYYLHYPFEGGYSVTVTMNMATDDWRNNFMGVRVYDAEHNSSFTNASNLSNGRVNYISYKKITFSFTPNQNMTDVYIDLYSTNVSNTAFTGVSNWNLSSVYLNDSYYNSGSGSGGSGSTSSDTTSIINNDNNNTNSIINNNNENTNNIIENNNSNTNSIINNNNENTDKIVNGLSNVCSNKIDLTKISNCRFYNNSNDTSCDSTINNINNSTGTVIFTANAAWQGFSTDYVSVSNSTNYYLKFNRGSIFDGIVKVNFYTSNYTFISQTSAWNNNLSSFTTPSNCSYIRISFEHQSNVSNITLSNIMLSEKNVSFCAFGSSTSKIDDSNDKLNDINDSLTDETVPSVNFIDVSVTTDTPISDLLLMPLTILNKLVNTLNVNSCTDYTLPFDFFGGNSSITFPCFTLSDYIGNYANVVDGLFCLIMTYEIAMMCVTIFNDITSLRDTFDGLYQPKHSIGSYTGRHGGGN